MTRFVVYGANRSGSHYLQSLLNNHPDIKCYWDIFWEKGNTPYCINAFLLSNNRKNVPKYFGRAKLIRKFLENHYLISNNASASGFLLKWSVANRYPEILKWMQSNKIRIVHIARENFLIQQVALELRRRGIVTSHSRTDTEFNKVLIDTDNLLANLITLKNGLEAQRKKISNHVTLEVKYENMLIHEVTELERIFQFLEVSKARSLKSEFNKTESEVPSLMIINYQEVYKILENTEFSYLLR